MYSPWLLLVAVTLPLSEAAQTILGVYIFSRHGDRTAKSTPPANLTDLGYQEVFTSGTYFRDRYISSNASSKIAGINTDLVKLSQITASAPLDNVLMSSTQGFLQGLYPPVGTTLGSSILRNNTVVQAPLNGYQLIPIETVTSGTGSEDSAWLQGSSNCANAEISSNEYFTTPEYMSLSNSSMDFYTSLTPMINGTFNNSQSNYYNAYLIFDLLNVASIHNATINSSTLLTPTTLSQTRTLADTHEWNLAYNSSSPIRAITGATLAAQVLQALNTTITSAGKSKLNVQFGAYGGFQSFFGLAQLPQQNSDFYGVPDYASTMTFELFTNASTAEPFPAVEDISVRFLWHNGTTSDLSTPVAYPLFGQQALSLPWTTFADQMNAFAIGSQQQWCSACGNTTGICASSAPASPSPGSGSTSSASASGGGGGVSKAVAGVIGAMVTLAVVLGAEALIMLAAGLRVVRKAALGGGQNGSAAAALTKA
ncbi:hypothetical protein MMC06_006730 [Schaereria dolodes]|nr:hypothetical protein [Schaereria dolodes]